MSHTVTIASSDTGDLDVCCSCGVYLSESHSSMTLDQINELAHEHIVEAEQVTPAETEYLRSFG